MVRFRINMRFFNSCARLYIVINTVLLIPSNVLSKSIIFTCTENKYRSNDGSCNNLQHPEWGISNSAYLRLLPYSSDEFVSKLPSIDTISKETVSFIQNKAVSSQLPKTGIFQMWSMLLLMDLDLPSGVNELRNEATAYLDASFLYNPSEYLNFTYTIGNGDLVYNTCESCKNLNSHSKTLILLLVNEHNRIAGLLRRKNPHLDSTSVFEESRKVVIAEIQHITYTQYLPLLLGEIMNQKNGHTTNSNVFNIEKTVYNEKIQTEIYYDVADILFQLMRRNYFEINSKNLSEKIENLLQYLDETNRDFVNSSNEDNLRQILQITRKHKLSTYNEGKQFCQDYNNKFPFYFSSHKNENQNVLKLMYNDLSDAELLVGALTESNIPNGIFGPTLSCIADIQFENIKRGDRFWYSNQNFDASFTNDQLKELKQVTISSLICSNLNDYMKSVQENAFLKFDPIINPRNLCHLKKSLSLNSWNKNHKFYRVLNNTIIKDAIRKAEDNLSRRRQTEYLLYSKEGGADPKSPVGTAAAFSKPNRNALLLANNSILLEYASKELMETLNQRYGSRLRKRQIFDSDDITFSITDDLAGNFLQDLDIATNLPDISRELDGNCPLEIAACDPKYPYRSFTGYCNNLRKPNFGKSLTTFSRILSSVYENGISTPRQFSVTRIPLPSARLVSSMMHLDISNLDMKHSMMLMQLAQFIDHDITFTPVHKGFFASIPDCRPCDSPRTVHPECMPIEVPPGDPYYPQINYTTGKQFCLPFMRSLPGQQRLGHRDQINQNSAFLDLSQVYGEHACLARQLRSYQGRLNTTTSLYGDKDLLPQTAMHPECRSSSGYCFLAGDGRASEQPALTAIHTIFMREHNRLADNLRHLNPHWEDERIFQQARKILVGKYQHILYNEFLPRILGSNAMNLYGLNLEKPNQYFTGYSDECNPSALTEFASAAFRIGHSLLRPHLTRLSPTMQPLEPSILLRETFFNPDIIYKRHIIDEITRGLYSTPVETLDQFITKEITNHLFEDKKIPFSGMDLPALNVQRARDHGIPSYNEYRTMCNLKRAVTWEDFSKELAPDVINRLKRLYPTVDDVDLFPAGISERPIPGGLVGPTFACIISLQFRQLRKCDRFWYETSDPVLRFTPDQLTEIRKASLAKIICDNLDIQSPIQRHILDLPSEENPMFHCQELQHLNLKPWKDIESVCETQGRILNVGEYYLPTPCTSCVCTVEGIKCTTIRVTNCLKLIEEVGQAAVLKDEICSVQCSSYITLKNEDTIVDRLPGLTSEGRGINFYLAAGLKPPPVTIHRRKNPISRNFKLRDFSIVVG